MAFDTPTSDSYRVAAESRDRSATFSVRIRQTSRHCRLRRWISQFLSKLGTAPGRSWAQHSAEERKVSRLVSPRNPESWRRVLKPHESAQADVTDTNTRF